MKNNVKWLLGIITVMIFTACGGGGSSEPDAQVDIVNPSDTNKTFYMMTTDFEDVPFVMTQEENTAFSAFQTNEDNTNINSVTHTLEDGSKLSLSFDPKGYLLTASTDEVIYLFSNYTFDSVGVSIVDINGNIVVEYVTHQFSDEMKAFIQSISSKISPSLSPKLSSNIILSEPFYQPVYDNTIFTSVLKWSSHGITLLSSASSTVAKTGTFTIKQLGQNVIKQAVKAFIKSESDDLIVTTWNVVDILKNSAGCFSGSTVSCGKLVYTTVKNISTLYDIYQELESDNTLEINLQHHLDVLENIQEVRRIRKEMLLQDELLQEEVNKVPVEYDDESTECTKFSQDLNCLVEREKHSVN